MADPIIDIDVKGLDIVARNMKEFGDEIRRDISAAGREAGEEVVNTVGARRYPPATAANQPGRTRVDGSRMGYYVRGRGAMVPTRGGGYKSLGNSERYGSRFTIKREGYGATIGNNASYAKYLGGEEQAKRMEAIGWRKLIDIANEKVHRITEIYDAWIARLINRLDLK
jgi:phage gpG-like protein